MTDEQIATIIDAIVTLLVATIPIILGVATKYLAGYLKEQQNQLQKQGRHEDLLLLRRIARLAILAAEEIETEAKAKNHYVQLEIYKAAKSAGIPISQRQVQLLLEGSLREVKLELNDLPK
jgi:hypothetical protein